MMKSITYFDLQAKQQSQLLIKNICRSSKSKIKFEFVTIPSHKDLKMVKTTLYNIIKKELGLSNDYNILLNSVFNKFPSEYQFNDNLVLQENRTIYLISKRLSFFVDDESKTYNYCISDNLEDFLKNFGISLVDVEDRCEN